MQLPASQQPLRDSCSVRVGDFVVVRMPASGAPELAALQASTHPEVPRLQQHWGSAHLAVMQVTAIYAVPRPSWEPTRHSDMPPPSEREYALAGRPLWDAAAAAARLGVQLASLPAGVRAPLSLVFSHAGVEAHVLLDAVVRKAAVQWWDGRAQDVTPLQAVAPLVSATATPVRFRASHTAEPPLNAAV